MTRRTGWLRNLHRTQAGITLAVLAALITLRISGTIGTETALHLFLVFEVPMVILFAAVTAVRFSRIRPAEKSLGTGILTHIVEEEPLLGPAVAELRLFASLARLVAGRPRIPRGALPFGYAKRTMTVPAVMVALSVAELAIVHLIVPWQWLRIALLILTVWGVLYMFGFFAALIVSPHLVVGGELHLRWGHKNVLSTPLDNVCEATRFTNHSHVRPHAEKSLLVLTQSLSTNVRIRFAEPVPMTPPLPKRTQSDGFYATEVWCRVDNPDAFVRALSIV